MNVRFLFIVLSIVMTVSASGQQLPVIINSPDNNIEVSCQVTTTGKAMYSIAYKGNRVLQPSRLGLTGNTMNLADAMRLESVSPIELVNDQYELFTGKRTMNKYLANRRVLKMVNSKGEPLHIIFQVSNDGVAFRYYFPNTNGNTQTITSEQTSFKFNENTRAFLQPMQIAKSGWEQTNPAYEEHYQQNIPVGTPSPTGVGWVYPALFQDNDTWVLITEAGLEGNYCATRLQHNSTGGEYQVGFPDTRETMTTDGILPKVSGTQYSPWRVITIGSLKTIAESTLGTDVAAPLKTVDTSFIKPGKASWSWIMSKDDFIVYDEQIKYIDLAARMHWQYCLVDAAWDAKIGYDKIKQLAAYAATKNVGLLLWYNSAGDWNTVKYTPRNKLLTHDTRLAEFARLKAIGIKGVKIDFFGGDGRSVIQYYIDILEDAGKVGLLVNFHGATLPRGWQRTYPQLLTTEAVKGFEMVTFNQADADAQPNHCAMLPFTRNAFDPMDFTPINLYKIPTQVVRKTSSAFELALSVLFLSGIQHIAESPEGMNQVPTYVQTFLQQVPNRWDDVRFIDGFPGKYVIIARRAANKWYIAGINGEENERTIAMDVSSFGKNNMTLITDGAVPLSFQQLKTTVQRGVEQQVILKPNGGFVMVLE